MMITIKINATLYNKYSKYCHQKGQDINKEIEALIYNKMKSKRWQQIKNKWIIK